MSSRGGGEPVSFSQALRSNLAPDGGLYCPQRLDPLPADFLDALGRLPPDAIARRVAAHLLAAEIPPPELDAIVERALDFPIPLVAVGEGVWALELYWGPTLAFKDVGARFMAQVMRHYRGDRAGTTLVLVATSGDTGSAAANAFLGLDGFHVVVLFPEGQISEPQRKLLTTLGGNTSSLAVRGTFDDCQRLVKEAFADAELRRRRMLATANSISVGRLLPQILYYFLGVAQLPEGSPPPVIATPSGNFGNLTAGLYAKRLGLEAERFVAATNINDVVPEYLETGVFRPRPSQRTLANAMDVGNPSNFERILHLYGGDVEAARRDLEGSRHTDREVVDAIRRVHQATGYVLDPHGAIGYLALEAIRPRYPESPGMFLATAHPAKFPTAVEPAIGHPIEIPEALAGPLSRPEVVVPIAASLDQLRAFLLGL